MYKLITSTQDAYAEIEQVNPLRWVILHRKRDIFKNQSERFKCKDFFNDVVAWRKGKHKFVKYGFKNNVKFNREGLYVHLQNVNSCFLVNLEVLEKKLTEDLGTCLRCSYIDNGLVVILPTKCFNNTYLISLLTAMIRFCNYDYKYESWEDFFNEDAPMNTAEECFNVGAKDLIKKWGFKVPNKYKKYWYYSSWGWNNVDKEVVNSGIIHDNGVSSWANALTQQ